MQRGRSPGNDDGRASVAAATSALEGGFHDRRRSRSGGSGSSGGSGRRHGPSASSASAQPGGSVSGNVGNSKNGVSPRGQRKDVLIYSYVMHQQQQMQQGRRHQLLPSRRKHLRSPFFASLRRRSSEANSNNDGNNTNTMGDESIGGGDNQQQGSLPRGNCSNNIDDDSNNKKCSPQHRNNYNSNPWTLPPNSQLAPRMDIWRILTVSSCAAVASIGQTFASTNSSSSSDKYAFSSWDKLALSTCILTFVSSLLMAVGVRYTPFRRNVTQPFFNSNSEVSREQGRLLSRLQLMTVEILILTVLSILWIFSMPVIVNGNAYYNSSMVSAIWMGFSRG